MTVVGSSEVSVGGMLRSLQVSTANTDAAHALQLWSLNMNSLHDLGSPGAASCKRPRSSTEGCCCDMRQLHADTRGSDGVADMLTGKSQNSLVHEQVPCKVQAQGSLQG